MLCILLWNFMTCYNFLSVFAPPPFFLINLEFKLLIVYKKKGVERKFYWYIIYQNYTTPSSYKL